MTREELQRLYSECVSRAFRAEQLAGLVRGVESFLAEPDPTVEIAYLKAKVADLGDEYHTRWTQGRRPPMSHDDIKAALEAASTPWESIPTSLDDERRVVREDGGDLAYGCSCDYSTMSSADAHLVANAPEWLAELLAENERLRDSIQHCADTLALHECERPEIERLTDENDRLRLADDYKPEGVDIVMAKLRDYRRRAEAAEQTNQRVRGLAEAWATQPNDYDEDTEQQIEDGKAILRALDGGAS